MAEKGIDEAGKKYIRVTLGELDQAAVRIYPAPLVTGDVARRRELISFEYWELIDGRESWDVHGNTTHCSAPASGVHLTGMNLVPR